MTPAPTAIVTRAGTGVGPALALALAERGWRLVLDGKDARPLEAQAAGLATATEVAVVPGDVGDADHREALIAAAGPSLELLVNNSMPLDADEPPAEDDYPLDHLEDAYRDTVLAPLALVQLALPRLASNGSIVNVVPSDDGGVRGDVGDSARAALEELTDAIAAAYPHLRIQVAHTARTRSESQGADGIVEGLLPSERSSPA